jgi:D-alanyl-D-alanine carboxypeptidase
MEEEVAKASQEIRRLVVESAPPYVSAKSWTVANGKTGELMFSKGENERREIASLTKIMTALTALDLADKYEIDLFVDCVTISCMAIRVIGTKARLQQGDKLTLWDLFHALMLPSGNDAAIAMADYFGQILAEEQEQAGAGAGADDKVDKPKPTPMKLFVQEMNNNAKKLHLSNTSFANPHGLRNYFNKSSAADIARLSAVAMKNRNFKAIVKRRKYKCVAETRYGEEKVFLWKNTNKLLSKGFNGLKTGITPSAGPCLATSIECPEFCLIIVILNSKSMEIRWAEIQKLTNWAVDRLKKIAKIIKNNKFPIKFLKSLQHV